MKRVLNAIQWVVFAGFAVAILWLVFRSEPPLDYSPESWSNWDGFMTISYAGVTRGENTPYPSSKTLHDHLEALHKTGYRTITTGDALAFLEGRSPLPSKAVLILFEGGRKETFIRAHPVLRKYGMRATLCLPSDPVEGWDESCLKKGDIRKIVAMPQWEIASMGGNTVELIETTDGRKDHFLSTRKWIAGEKRLETDAEFRARLEQDYRMSAGMLAKLNGSQVAAYVYPYADDGRRVGADPLAAEINFAGLTNHYLMAFVSASNPFNPPGRSPYALSRLRVAGDWSAAQVLTSLKRAIPLTDRVVEVGASDRWQLLGNARVIRDELKLSDEDSAWIRGSDLWTDARISVAINRTPGAIAVCYARLLSPADCLRLSIDNKDIRLQESRNGVPVTLKTVAAPTGQVIRLDWKIKGLRAWLNVNDVPVFGPVPLASPRASGAIGFESRGGGVSLSELSVKPLIKSGVVVDSWRRLPLEKREVITDYLPPFPAVGEMIPSQLGLDCIQAVSEGAEVWPILTAPLQVGDPDAQIASMVAQLMRQDLRPFIKGFVVESAQAQWIEPLREQGFQIMHRVKTGEAMPVSVTNKMDHVWLDMTGTNVVQIAGQFLQRHPPSQLMVVDEAVRRQIPRVEQVMVWGDEEGKRP